jgi:hypothetical protein
MMGVRSTITFVVLPQRASSWRRNTRREDGRDRTRAQKKARSAHLGSAIDPALLFAGASVVLVIAQFAIFSPAADGPHATDDEPAMAMFKIVFVNIAAACWAHD